MLEKIELFSGMSTSELLEIEHIIETISYNRGDIMFREGDFSRDFYIVLTGQVELSIKNVLQESKTINIMKNGDFFGEMSLFDKGGSRSMTAQALQNACLLRIPGARFETLLNEKPAICFKMLGALSKRLKDANLHRDFQKPAKGRVMAGKTIVVASARNGSGKTTFSTTLAQLLSNEQELRILYIDLDLYFADGTSALGVFSPKSILELSTLMRAGIPTWELLQNGLVKHNENLYVLPAPNDFIDGEKVKAADLSSILNASRGFFDYIIIDTDSGVTEVFLASIDAADQILFLVNVQSSMAIKSDFRYFKGIDHLKLPPEKCSILAIRAGPDFRPEEMGRLFKFKILNVLPRIERTPLEYGQSIYFLAPQGSYCEVLRSVFQSLFPEHLAPKGPERGFFYRLFFPKEPAKARTDPTVNPGEGEQSGLALADENSSALINIIRLTISQGNWDKAFRDLMSLVEMFPRSSAILQALGEVCFYQKNFQLGIDALRKALSLDPENHYAMGILGVIQMDEHLKRRSLEIVRRKIDLRPDFPDLYNDLGKLLFSFKDFKGAKGAFEKALALNPGFSEALINLAVNFGETQDFRKSIVLLQTVDPKSLRIFYLLGCFLFSIGEFNDSFRAFSKAAEDNPHYLDVTERLESLREYFKRLTLLLKMHQDSAKTYPNFPDLNYKAGNVLMLLGRKEEAIQEFNKALALNPEYQEARVKLEEVKSGRRVLPEESWVDPGSEGEKVEFKFELSLENLHHYSEEDGEKFRQVSMAVINFRTGKEISNQIPITSFQNGSFLVECRPIGPVLAGDLLLIQVVDGGSKRILATIPHLISEDEVKNGKAKQHIAPIEDALWNFQAGLDSHKRIPIQYFYVRFFCPHLGEFISGENPPVRAEIQNPNTGAVSKGRPNSETPGESDFVFFSQDGKEVVREGDKLTFRLLDRSGNIFFSMDFPVLKEDIEEFSKTLSAEFLGNLLLENPKLSPSARLPDPAAPEIGKAAG